MFKLRVDCWSKYPCVITSRKWTNDCFPAALVVKLMGISCVFLLPCSLSSDLFHLLRSVAQNCFTFKKFSETVHHLHLNWWFWICKVGSLFLLILRRVDALFLTDRRKRRTNRQLCLCECSNKCIASDFTEKGPSLHNKDFVLKIVNLCKKFK